MSDFRTEINIPLIQILPCLLWCLTRQSATNRVGMSCRSGGSEGYVSYPVGSLPISVKGIRQASHNNNTPMSGAFTSFVPSFSRTANNPRLKLTGYRGQCISLPHPLPILYVELLILQGWSARGRLSECSGLPAHLSLDSPASRLLLIVRPPRI